MTMSNETEPRFSCASRSCNPFGAIAAPVVLQNTVDSVGKIFHSMARVLRKAEIFHVWLVVIAAVDIQQVLCSSSYTFQKLFALIRISLLVLVKQIYSLSKSGGIFLSFGF